LIFAGHDGKFALDEREIPMDHSTGMATRELEAIHVKLIIQIHQLKFSQTSLEWILLRTGRRAIASSFFYLITTPSIAQSTTPHR